MKQLHMTLSPKGGIGKSFIASLLTQWLHARGLDPIAFDNDPANATFKSFQALNVRKLDLLDGRRADRRASNPMYETILAEPGPFVVDNGGSNYLDLMSMLEEADLINGLADEGIQTTVHVPIKGGGDLNEAVEGFRVVASDPVLERARLVVWLNEHEGPIVGNGVKWEDMKVYNNHKKRIHSVMTLRQQPADTVGRVMTNLLKRKMTFAEIDGSLEFDFVDKRMIRGFFQEVCDDLDLLVGAGVSEEAA